MPRIVCRPSRNVYESGTFFGGVPSLERPLTCRFATPPMAGPVILSTHVVFGALGEDLLVDQRSVRRISVRS